MNETKANPFEATVEKTLGPASPIRGPGTVADQLDDFITKLNAAETQAKRVLQLIEGIKRMIG